MKRISATVIALGLTAFALAGCGTSPASFGITGPGTSPGGLAARPSTDDAALPSAGGVVPASGATFAPSMVPTFGSNGRYYGNDN